MPPRDDSTLRVAARVLSPADAAYPAGLRDLDRAPERLRVAGALPSFDRAVAVVGTRASDADAHDFAFSLGAGLARLGCPVVSGGAYGIDAAAHEGALDAGGVTVAVLATGFGRAYPRRHAPLFERIVAEGGALVTEVDDDTPPRPGRFLARNRLIAALGAATVVVQAPLRSGARSTAAHARSLGRPVLAVPAAPWDPRGAGCLAELRAGAHLCADPHDVLELGLGEPRARSRSAERASRPAASAAPASHPDPAARAVLAALGGRPRHIDELAEATRLTAAELSRTLVLLTLEGLVRDRGGGRYAPCHSTTTL
ncbi:MAG: DNA-processing protein DprA [Myxococcales bacterium]|nr:DNA-processing protein DprA [Myxococcales bacterium]